jgi:leucyl/phenylalanyl-tRNA--protein transferase
MSHHHPFLLDNASDAPFPPAELALRSPDGLLAVGGDLSCERLLNAYTKGIFPWYSQGQPILWWSPDPRMVFHTDAVRLSARFKRSLRHCRWQIRADTAFRQVMTACASSPRPGQDGTWITDEMLEAYARLHAAGHAHSVEVWDQQALVGGIYGVAIGRMFFGESMFSGRSGGSKIALAALAMRLHQWGWPLIDAQVENPHLLSLGAKHCPRSSFLEQATRLVRQEDSAQPWRTRFGEFPAHALVDSTCN